MSSYNQPFIKQCLKEFFHWSDEYVGSGSSYYDAMRIQEFSDLDTNNIEAVSDRYILGEGYLWELLQHFSSTEKYSNPQHQLVPIVEKYKVSHKKVVDYGCGWSSAGVVFADYGYEVTLADLPSKMLLCVKYALKKLGYTNIKYIFIDKVLPLTNNYDIIWSSEVFEHIPGNYAKSIYEHLVEHLNMNGLMMFTINWGNDNMGHISGNSPDGMLGNDKRLEFSGDRIFGHAVYKKVK